MDQREKQNIKEKLKELSEIFGEASYAKLTNRNIVFDMYFPIKYMSNPIPYPDPVPTREPHFQLPPGMKPLPRLPSKPRKSYINPKDNLIPIRQQENIMGLSGSNDFSASIPLEVFYQSGYIIIGTNLVIDEDGNGLDCLLPILPIRRYVSQLKVVDLRKECTDLGLSTAGLKSDMVNRLESAYRTELSSCVSSRTKEIGHERTLVLLYDTINEYFETQFAFEEDGLIVGHMSDTMLKRLQDHYRRLYSFNPLKTHKQIQKLRQEITTMSKQMKNESTKNLRDLREFTISSLLKFNNKLRLIEQKIKRSFPVS